MRSWIKSWLLATLLLAVGSVTSEKCGTSSDGQLLVAQEGQIWHLDPDDKSREARASAGIPVSFAYSYTRETLYYSDIGTRQVYALKGQSSAARVVVARQGEWLPWGIGVDDANGKLYMAESFAGTLHAYDLASGESSVVIGTNITEPKDVVIDADEGYLFVLDKHQILRAELDGSNPTPIYQELKTIDQLLDELPKDLADAIIGSIRPPLDRSKTYRKPISIAGLTVDVKSKRLYWVDARKRTVESSDYNGQNSKVHFRDTSVEGGVESLVSLAVLKGAIYWADGVTKKLMKIEADESRVILNGVETYAIAAVDCEQRAKADANPCADNECQQLCLRSKSSATGYNCACHVGLELAHDGRTCDSVRDFVVFTQGAYLRGQSLAESRKDVIEPSRFSVGKGSAIDLDVNSAVVYYSSLFPHDQLHEIQLRSGQTRTLSPDLLSKSTGHIAYDWTTKNLYYLTYYYADATTLSVTNVRDPTYSKLLIRNVPRLVRGLKVHPNKGYVFLAILDNGRGTISRLTTEGAGLELILDFGRVNSLDALAVDYDQDRIYWSETRTSGEQLVRHANLDGQDVRTLDLAKSLKAANALAIDAKYVYAINDDELLYRVDKSGKNPIGLVNADQLSGSLSDLKLYSRSIQTTRPDHPCKSHGCQKFCFAVPTTQSSVLTAVCGCPYGEKLAQDGASCVDNSEREPAFLPCKYTSFKCNMQTASSTAGSI